jgi:hypothetical protein
MIKELLNRNDEVYLTHDDIRDEEAIQTLLCGLKPDFIIKKKGDRLKTSLLQIHVASLPSAEVKDKYAGLSFFSKYMPLSFFVGVTDRNVRLMLTQFVSTKDIDYLYQNLSLFCECIKLGRFTSADIENVHAHVSETSPVPKANSKFRIDLAAYAANITDQRFI